MITLITFSHFRYYNLSVYLSVSLLSITYLSEHDLTSLHTRRNIVYFIRIQTTARFKSYIIIGKLRHVFWFHFFHFLLLLIGDDISSHLSRAWWGSSELIYAYSLEKYLVHSKCYVFGYYYLQIKSELHFLIILSVVHRSPKRWCNFVLYY